MREDGHYIPGETEGTRNSVPLAHSKTAGEYKKHLDELKQTNLRSVIDYVLENWHPIREQWVACFKDKHLNLGETINNRLESTFS